MIDVVDQSPKKNDGRAVEMKGVCVVGGVDMTDSCTGPRYFGTSEAN